MSSDSEYDKASPVHHENGDDSVFAIPAHSNQKLPKHVIANFESRQAELSRYTGYTTQIAIEEHLQNSPNATMTATDELELTTVLGNTAGMVFAWALHYLSVRFGWYQNKKSQNPLYRNLKTLFYVGFALGSLITSIVPLPESGKKILSCIIASGTCLAIGSLAIPYWLLRQYYFKIDSQENKEKTFQVVGDESWSKSGKTLSVGGMSLGQTLGYAFSDKNNVASTMAKDGEIASISAFVIGLMLIPMINKISEKLGYGKILKTDKDTFRNNYVRSGMTLGLSLGAVAGFLIGSFLLPGMGSVVGATVGGAIGSLGGGLVFGIKGKNITAYTKKHWNIGEKSDNSWDYASRSASFAFAAVGALIGFFIPIPGSTILFANIFTAIGWGVGLGIVRTARKIQPNEEKAELSGNLPWTQRTAYGVNLGTMIGGTIGCIIGLVGGPLGILAAGTLGSAIGGVIGGVFKAFYGKQNRKTMMKAFCKQQPDAPLANNPTTSTASTLRVITENSFLTDTLPPSSPAAPCKRKNNVVEKTAPWIKHSLLKKPVPTSRTQYNQNAYEKISTPQWKPKRDNPDVYEKTHGPHWRLKHGIMQ